MLDVVSVSIRFDVPNGKDVIVKPGCAFATGEHTINIEFGDWFNAVAMTMDRSQAKQVRDGISRLLDGWNTNMFRHMDENHNPISAPEVAA